MSTAFFDIANAALGIPVVGAADSDFFVRTAASTQKMFMACGSNVVPAAVFATSNVAIGGLVSPAFTLDVLGDINFTGKLFQQGQRYIGSQWTTVNASNAIYITSCNVGINTDSPSASLDVNGSINFTSNLLQNGRPYIGSQWRTNSTSNSISISCNVGIGTTTPETLLHVAGNTRIDGGIIVQNSYINLTRLKVVQTQVAGAIGNITSIVTSVPGVKNTAPQFTFTLSNPQTQYLFQNFNTSNMMIAGPSNLSIYTARAGMGGIKIAVPSAQSNDMWWLGFTTSNRTSDTDDYARIGTVISNSNGGALYFTTGKSNAQSEVMRITDDGMVGVGLSNPTFKLHVNGAIFATQDIGAYSDLRLKCNIEKLENCLNKVKLCSGYKYDMRNQPDAKRRSIGLIAQEVELIAPELIHEDRDGFKAIAYQNMAALFVEAIKELADKVDKINRHLSIS